MLFTCRIVRMQKWIQLHTITHNLKMQNQSYDHSYAEVAYVYDAERDAQRNRSRDENSRERDLFLCASLSAS